MYTLSMGKFMSYGEGMGIIVSSKDEGPQGDDECVHNVSVVWLGVAGEGAGVALCLVRPELQQGDMAPILVFAGCTADGSAELRTRIVLLKPPTKPRPQPSQLALTAEGVARQN